MAKKAKRKREPLHLRAVAIPTAARQAGGEPYVHIIAGLVEDVLICRVPVHWRVMARVAVRGQWAGVEWRAG